MRKFLSKVMAFGIVSATIMSFGVSASFNPNKDPNGDGNLDLADAIYITQYLVGYREPANLTPLDVDENDVVSKVDAEYVQMYGLGLLGGSTTEEFFEDEVNTSYITRYYNVYNAQTGSYLRNYYLSVPIHNNITSTYESNEPESSRGIVGSTDDRISDWSNRGTAKVMCSVSEWGAGYRGSGFVVGPHTIATAAHVVYDTENDYAFKLSEILVFDADHTSHSFTPVEYHIPLSFVNETGYTEVNDYALITVEEDLSNYNSFVLGSVTDTAATNQLTVASVGFPQYIYSNIQSSSVYTTTLINDETTHDERLSTGSVVYVDSNRIRFTADTSGGNSGGPIYAVETLNGITYHTIVGINVAEPENCHVYAPYNIGVRFNASILKFYKANNANINY